MSTVPRSVESPPFTGKWCNSDGTLTPLAKVFVERQFVRTGSAIGVDAAYTAQQSSTASVASQGADAKAVCALQEAKAALDLAQQTMTEARALAAQAREAMAAAQKALTLISTAATGPEARKALEEAQNSAILSLTASPRGQAAQLSDQSVIRTITNR